MMSRRNKFFSWRKLFYFSKKLFLIFKKFDTAAFISKLDASWIVHITPPMLLPKVQLHH